MNVKHFVMLFYGIRNLGLTDGPGTTLTLDD